jgi:2-keto-3-deoxy-L-rhamnonate aldolase RhmA
MTTINDPARARMAAGDICLGLGLRQARTMDTGRVLATCGYDWAFIDCEHGSMDVDTTVQLCVAIHDAGVTPLVRVPGYEHHLASRLLDGGAMGIVFPHVDTAELARQLVSNCKYPPMGHRSYGGPMAQLGFAPAGYTEATEAVNAQTTLVMMVESPTSVENVDEIAAVDGVDVLFVGTNDLLLEMGLPGQFDHPDLEAALRRVVEACHKHGKVPGFGGIGDDGLAAKFVQMGMRFILASSDLFLLMSGARERRRFYRGIDLKG